MTAFDRDRRIAHGPWPAVCQDLDRYCAREPDAQVWIFEDATGERLVWPMVGPPAWRVAPPDGAGESEPPLTAPIGAVATPRPAGRPRLGVVAREVTLLPEDWQWLATQPGGASAVLRRLVQAARHEAQRRERHQQVCAAAFRCLGALGDRLAQADEALLAIYAGDQSRFEQLAQHWPGDWPDYLRRLGFPEAS